MKKRLGWLVVLCAAAAVVWRGLGSRRQAGAQWARPGGTPAPGRAGASIPMGPGDTLSVPPVPAAGGAAPEAAVPAAVLTDRDAEAASGALDLAEAARVLGCSSEEATALLDGRPTTVEAVEELALEHYRWRRHVDDPDSYWVTLKQASTILGVSAQRVKQLLEHGEVPYVTHRDGVRLMRRADLAR